MPLISVIIPTHNGTTRFLDQALESVFGQTYSDWELIIVDDASTDDTAAYVQDRLRSCDHPVEYIQRSVNGGPSAARNDGARVAKGTFLAFLDQDDLWHPTFLEETLAQLRDTPQDVGAIHTDRWDISAKGKRLRYKFGYDLRFRYTRITPILCQGNCGIIGMVVKRQAFESLGGFDEQLRTGEDGDFLIRLHQSYTMKHIPKPLYSYRIRYGTSAHKLRAPLFVQQQNRFYWLQKHAHRCVDDAGLRRAFQAELALGYSTYGKYLMVIQRDKQTARHYFLAALRMKITPKHLLRYLWSYLPTFG